MRSSTQQTMFGQVDWTSVAIYLLLVLMGWFNIYAAAYDEAHASIVDMTQNYGKQMMWIGVSLFLGIAILLIDEKYYHMLAYPFYGVVLLTVVAVAFLGKEVKGAHSWIMLGPFALQPAEFMKFATSLALARYISNYSFSITRRKDLLSVGAILAMPVLAIFLQNDTGSAVVYGSFIFMLYREGFNGWFYVAVFLAVALFVFSFLLTPLTLILLLLLGCALGQGIGTGRWRGVIVYLSAVALATMSVWAMGNMVLDREITVYVALLVSVGVSLIPLTVIAVRTRMGSLMRYAGLFVAAVVFSFTIDYVFDNVMQIHQQKRVLDLLGLESDLKGWGYNVNQSKIAIGSGGLLGKGYLEGTQTKYNFVPEQSTDFIFCTVGEEWGFVGCAVVLSLFCVLILRLMRMGERQKEPFGRVYCYCVASLFLMHVAVNVGMTIGLMPVIGIPLPFFSYGGSSMIAFTLLFFVAVKLDSTKRETNIYPV